MPSVKSLLTPDAPRRAVPNERFVGFVRRVLRAYARRVGDGDIDALSDLVGLRGELDELITSAVHQLRSEEGGAYSWDEIARRLGISRQAAQQRYGGAGARQPGGQPANLR